MIHFSVFYFDSEDIIAAVDACSKNSNCIIMFGSWSYLKEPTYNFGGDHKAYFSYLTEEQAQFIKSFLLERDFTEKDFE
jgi:hypothetical protein